MVEEKYCRFADKCHILNVDIRHGIEKEVLSSTELLKCLEQCYSPNFETCKVRQVYSELERGSN